MHPLKTLLLLVPLTLQALAAPPDSDSDSDSDIVIGSRDNTLASSFPEMDMLTARELGVQLTKRACDDKSGCKCAKNHAGVWCAECMRDGKYVVTTLGKNDYDLDHVYQCSKGGGCCDYGYAKKCKGGKAGRCGD